MSADRPCPDPEPWAGAWRIAEVTWLGLPARSAVVRADGFVLRVGDVVLPNERITFETHPAHPALTVIAPVLARLDEVRADPTEAP